MLVPDPTAAGELHREERTPKAGEIEEPRRYGTKPDAQVVKKRTEKEITLTLPIVVDRSYRYHGGILRQKCTQCSWQTSGLKSEHWQCPMCGASEEALRTSLSFGGLTVSVIRNRFTLVNRSGTGGYIDVADAPDTIAFLLKHNHFWYPST